MPTLRIPSPLRSYTGGEREVSVQAETVAEALEALMVHSPALRPHLQTEDGRLRPFVNVFLGGENVRDLQGLSTRLAPDATLLIIPSVAGGAHAAGTQNRGE